MRGRIPGAGGWLGAVAVVAAATAAYLNTLPHAFAFDDLWIIVNNRRVYDPSGLREIWFSPYWPASGTALGLYRPLTILAFAVEWALSGGRASVFHGVNVALHAGVSLLALLLLRRLLGRGAAVFGALVFAVHPLHTEAVANVVGQAELLGTAAVLAACLVYAGRPAGEAPGLGRLLAVALLYAAGLHAKENAVVLPALLVLVDLAQGRVTLNRKGIGAYARASAVPLLLLAAVAGAYLALRVDVLGSLAGTDRGPSLPFLREEHRVLAALRVWPEFARLLFFPDSLSADYSPAVILPPEGWSPMVLLGAGIVAAVAVLGALTPLRPRAGFPAAWFFVTVLPVSNLLFPIGVLMAERTLYLPSFAVAYVAAVLWERGLRLPSPRWRRAGAGAAALVLVLLSARTVVRNRDWRDTFVLMDALYRDHPESYRAQWARASLLEEAGDTTASELHWAMAYRLWPRDAQFLAEYGIHLLNTGRYDRAIELLETSRRDHPEIARTEEALAVAYLKVHRYRDALEATTRAVRLEGLKPYLLEYRARALMGLGRDGAAARLWRRAIREAGDGGSAEAWRMLAWALHRAGDSGEARAALDSARVRAGEDEALQGRIEAVARILEGGAEGEP